MIAAEVRLSLTAILTVFVVLKLTGIVGWSWWWVLAPFWAPAAFAGLWIMFGLAVVLIRGLLDRDT